ncbi:MAG: hypothetical protein M5U16_01225 [Hyphomicrobium sp.]|nr:hypothetical protein [Hyphomicrobium sp.]
MKFEDRESIPGFGHGYHLKDQFTDFKAKYSVSYRYPGKTKLFMWAITAYYDDQDKLKLMMAKDIFVHDPVNN